jgi:murein peptide amidase A
MSEPVMPLFDPVAYVRDVEEAAKADGWTVRYLSPVDGVARPWLQRTASAGSSAPKLYISSGIHGDEVSGPYAILALLRQLDFFAAFDTTIFPILNPNGLARNLRLNAAGIDLNRDYRDTKSDEIHSHIEALKTLPHYDACMMLHEDYEGIGAYLYELNDKLMLGLGGKIIAAMGQHVPIDMRPEIEEVKAVGGVIQRSDLILKLGPIADRPEWAEAIYLSVHHSKVSITTETPKPFPLENRVKAQIAAIQTVMEALQIEVPRP